MSKKDNSVVLDIDPMDIFYADSFSIRWRKILGTIYLILSLFILGGAFTFPDLQTLFCWRYFFLLTGIAILLASLTFFILAWHKQGYRTIITEDGFGVGNRFKIPLHLWSEVRSILERHYYGGTPPADGVWGSKPRRLDEDYTLILHNDERIVFSRKGLEQIYRCKSLLQQFSELYEIDWEIKEVYHSHRRKAEAKFYPYLYNFLLAMLPLFVLLSGVTIQAVNYYFEQTEFIAQQRDKSEGKMVWIMEFIERPKVARTSDKGAENASETQDSGAASRQKRGKSLFLDVLISSLYFSPDMRIAMLGENNGGFQIRDLVSGKIFLDKRAAHMTPLTFVDVNADRTLVLTRDFERQMRVWSMNSGFEMFTIGVPNKYYQSACFSADGKYIYQGRLEGEVFIYSSEDGKLMGRFNGAKSPVRQVACSLDNEKVLAAYDDNSLYVWNKTDQKKNVFTQSSSPIICVSFSPDNRFIIYSENRGYLRIWDYQTDRDVFRLAPTEHEYGVFTKAAISPNSTFVALGNAKGNVAILDLNKGRIVESFDIPDMASPIPIESLEFSDDSKFLFVGSRFGILRWRLKQ